MHIKADTLITLCRTVYDKKSGEWVKGADRENLELQAVRLAKVKNNCGHWREITLILTDRREVQQGFDGKWHFMIGTESTRTWAPECYDLEIEGGDE